MARPLLEAAYLVMWLEERPNDLPIVIGVHIYSEPSPSQAFSTPRRFSTVLWEVKAASFAHAQSEMLEAIPHEPWLRWVLPFLTRPLPRKS
jgi:hypothetical protein